MKKVFFIFIILIIIIIAAIVPVARIPTVKRGLTVDPSAAISMVQGARMHFDHPLQRTFVLRYQITNQQPWGESERYTVVGRTFFGIPLVKAAVFYDGGIVTIPVLINDAMPPADEYDDAQPTVLNTAEKTANGSSRIVFLHHSTGEVIWNGGVSEWFDAYNSEHGTDYHITEQAFPQESPYGWNNYPYDYWNIWVQHAGSSEYMDEQPLELLTAQYDTIVWKHCFPVSDIEADTGSPSVNSSDKTVENYKLQYNALKSKMREFPETDFIVWTGAAQAQGATTLEQAQRARDFFTWVVDDWDEKGDNIFVWDFYRLETEGGLYLMDAYAESADDSHPNSSFASRVAPMLAKRIVDVIEGKGDAGKITGA